jgi:predicted dehydrogenase
VSVTSATATFIKERPLEGDPTRTGTVTTDDAFQAMMCFANGATGMLEASKMCLGSQNRLKSEVNGSEGSLQFNGDHGAGDGGIRLRALLRA